MFLKRFSDYSGKSNVMEIPLSEKEYAQRFAQYRNGAKIQDAFSILTPEQREFIMTGITSEEWNLMFPRID